MKLANITVLTGQVHEFYSRALWTELIKAGASFTAEVDAEASGKVANKIVLAYTLQQKPAMQDAERLLYWVKQWANTHFTTHMQVSIYTTLSSAVTSKLNKMITGSELSAAVSGTHESIIPPAK